MRVAAGRFPDGVPPALAGDYLLYAMDASAKEAVKAALDGNGHALNLASDDDRQDEGAWGRIDGVALVGPGGGDSVPGADGRDAYPSFREAIEEGGWAPGDGFSFVVREVPARKKAMDLDALLRALDPDGTLRAEAEEQGIVLPGDDEVASLPELEADCAQRVRTAPSRATDEAAAFRGDGGKGYNVIARDALRRENREDDGTERQKSECAGEGPRGRSGAMCNERQVVPRRSLGRARATPWQEGPEDESNIVVVDAALTQAAMVIYPRDTEWSL